MDASQSSSHEGRKPRGDGVQISTIFFMISVSFYFLPVISPMVIRHLI